MKINLQKKINSSIKLIKAASKAAEKKGQLLEICYSGGKDSDVLLELTKMSEIKFRAIYKNTTIDPPGTIKHVLNNGVEIMNPKLTFKQIIEKKGLPSRNRRHCCDYLKEYKILDYAAIGVRRDESNKRNQYQEPTQCRIYRKNENVNLIMPLLEWTKADVKEFIEIQEIKCHPMYYDENENFHVERRLGCIGCPLAYYKNRIKEFKSYPNMVKLYIKAAQKFLDNHPNSSMFNYLNNATEWFLYSLYCDSIEEWNMRFKGKDLFGEKINCKVFIKQLFGIEI